MTTPNLPEIPIFPLNTVLFPGGMLPLRVFEQRYIEMTKSCLRDDAPFGACLIREGHEVGVPAVPEQVGCLAQITQWDMPHLGLFQLVARGARRYRIIESRVARNGLVSARIELFPEEPEAKVDIICRDILVAIIDKAGEARFPAPVSLDDPAWVAYRLAEILPIEMAVRQQLLELQDPGERFARLRAILAAQGLAP